MMRQDWIDMDADLAITLQCELAGVSRATMYAHQKPKVESADDLLLSRLIDEQYATHPYYGTRRMAVIISALVSFAVNRKRIQRLMQAMAPAPTPAGHTRSTLSTHTCCAAWKSPAPTRSGALTSPTSDWPKALSTWWR